MNKNIQEFSQFYGLGHFSPQNATVTAFGTHISAFSHFDVFGSVDR